MSQPASVSRPISVSLPGHGVYFAQSVHDARFEMAWRRDAFHKCFYVLRGTVVYEEPGAVRQTGTHAEACAGVIPAGRRHRLRDVDPATLLLLCLSREFIEAEPELRALWRTVAAPSGRAFRISPWGQERTESLWRRAMLEQTAARAGSSLLTRAAAIQVLVQLARVPPDRSTDAIARRVDQVRHDLEQSFFDDWNLDKASARAGLSRRHFSAQFRRRTGQTFLEYLTGLRLGHAASLLGAGDSIAGAAFASGYRDLSHFYRMFRATHGMPPGAWIRQIAGG